VTCREFIGFLMEYLLNEVDRQEFDAHLAECPSCVAYLKSYRETVKMSKAALSDLDQPLTDMPPEELIQAILASRRRNS
jgi:anti-sigma factor RsiW